MFEWLIPLVLIFGVILAWRARKRGIYIDDILYVVGFIVALAAIIYLPSQFERELSRGAIVLIEFMIALLCISLGYYFSKR